MRILAVDTATEVCGVSVMIGEEIVTESVTSQGLNHAQGLMPDIRAVLDKAGLTLKDLDAFVVTRGPGSFTGLRIGISTVKGLVAASGKPLIGVSTLTVLAHQAPDEFRWICPVIDARRGEVYWTLYERRPEGLQPICSENVGIIDKIYDSLNDPCMFIGNAVQRYASRIRDISPFPVYFADNRLNLIHPGVLARLGMKRFQLKLYDDPKQFAPIYLRKSDAKKSNKGILSRHPDIWVAEKPY